MATSLRHRGPDDNGLWSDTSVVLSHQRLAVVDLSADGHQPMPSASGRFALSYNGEIYNHAELRRDLESAGATFVGHSDTEVLVEAIARWGVASVLERANGMFAFAVFDREERRLVLARDRLGEKPLFYGWFGSVFAFASELRALTHVASTRPEVDRCSLVAYLRHGYVPEPRSIFVGVEKLPPGAIGIVDDRTSPGARLDISRYWTPEASRRLNVADTAAVEELDRLLRDSVAMRMMADVPVGAFLSGGIDSSVVVAMMQAQSGRAVRTFSIGFDDPTFNEAHHAAAVARHLGTDHTELYVTPAQARDVIPRLAEVYGEPFADSSQIPMFLVAELARRDVTVSLSGDGGDELFGGYDRYLWGRELWSAVRRVPRPIRRLVGRGLTSVRPTTWDAITRRVPALRRASGHRIARLGQVLSVTGPAALYLQVLSHVPDPASFVLGAVDPAAEEDAPTDVDGFTAWMAARDLSDYLPGDILTKLDRATMAVSLEGRVPLLDHRVVEFALGLPVDQKIRGTTTKWVLRQVLARYVPDVLVDRPKMGFGVPIGDWLRGPLRDWADDLLHPAALRNQGFLNVPAVVKCWSEHRKGVRDWQYVLWDVLMFESWLEAIKDPAGV